MVVNDAEKSALKVNLKYNGSTTRHFKKESA